MGDSLFIGSCSGRYYAFDTSSGELRWSYDTSRDGAPASFHGDALVTGGMVITGSDHTLGGHVYAFDLATGDVIWSRDVGGLETDLIATATTLIGGTSDGGLVALDLASGEPLWKFDNESLAERTAWALTPALDGERILFGGRDGKLYALSAETGEEIWARELGGTVSTPTRLIDSQIIVGTYSNELLRLDADNGEILARLELASFPHHSLVVAPGCLIVLVGERLAACVDHELDEIIWSRSTDDEWTTYNPLVVGESVLVGSADGELFSLRLEDGSPEWNAKLEGMLRGLGQAGDRLYVGTFSGTIYALGMPQR